MSVKLAESRVRVTRKKSKKIVSLYSIKEISKQAIVKSKMKLFK